MKNNNKFQQFLDGGEMPSNEKNKQEEEKFLNAYKELIHQSSEEPVPDFDAFEKVMTQHSEFQIKRFLPYVAVLVFLLSIPVLVHLINKKPKAPKYSEAEIIEARKNTTMALASFTEEWNNCVSNFNDVKIGGQIKEELKSLKEIKIEYNNPIKNLKFNEL